MEEKERYKDGWDPCILFPHLLNLTMTSLQLCTHDHGILIHQHHQSKHLRALKMEKTTQVHVPTIKLGSQGLMVSTLGFGCAGLSGFYNDPLSHEAGRLIIKEAFNKGITFFDTSDAYGTNHDNEFMVGKALKELPREKVQLATKFGFCDSIRSNETPFVVKGTPEYVRHCCEASLKRLDVNYIDLYYQHRVDTTVPIEDTVGELKKLVEEGKIKYIGLSEANADTIKRAHVVHPITSLQMEYSLWTREIEEEIIPLCRELGIGIVAYSPLGRGFFAGKAVEETLPSESILGMHQRFSRENLEKNKVFYKRLVDLASKHGCTPSQLALAWLLHQGNDIIPIPGTTKVTNLENNIGSLAMELKDEELTEISNAIPENEVAGAREFDILYKYSWKFSTTPSKSATWFANGKPYLVLHKLAGAFLVNQSLFEYVLRTSKESSWTPKSRGFIFSDAQLWNGKFAMLDLAALAFTEYVRGDIMNGRSRTKLYTVIF
ncbi:hypothetical protein VNO77_16527 [Canavalia gladiata]|uniref:NADP-dependent oxidoreductase domain-containing protein n=1 Tax=Canavalia gladiata TaxID=3824 RepID=A0AAN9M1W3_CANGL